MIIDGNTVETGSYNYTASAQNQKCWKLSNLS